MTNNKPTLTKADLTQFIGTENWYRHQFMRHCTYTDGVQFMAERAGAYWLVDDIIFGQSTVAGLNREPFQVWKLTVKQDQTATLVCEDGNGREIIRKDLTFTDFPLPEITLYFADNVLMLASEY